MEDRLAAPIQFEQGEAEVELLLGAGDRDIEEAPFLLLPHRIPERPRRRKAPIGRPEQKDRAPLEALGLMDRGERDTLVLFSPRDEILSNNASRRGEALTRHQRQVAQELLGRLIATGEGRQLVNLLLAGLVVGIGRLQVGPVPRIENARDLTPRRVARLSLCQIGQQAGKVVPALQYPARNRPDEGGSPDEGEWILLLGQPLPELLGGRRPNPWNHPQYPPPGQLVPWIDEQPQKARHIFDMRLLEEADPGADFVGDAAARQLQLQLERVGVGPVEHRHLPQGHPLVTQIEQSGRDKGRLLLDIPCRNQRRPESLTRTNRFELPGKLAHIVRDRGVGQGEDLRRRAVVAFEPKDLRLRIALLEEVQVLEVGASPAIDALRVVANDRQLAVAPRQQIEDLRLQEVGVLVLIDEDLLKLLLVERGNLRTVGQQPLPVDQQVVVIHPVPLTLELLIAGLDACQGFGERLKPGVPRDDQPRQGRRGVDREADDLLDHLGLREAVRSPISPDLVDGQPDQLPRVFGIENGVVVAIAEADGMASQKAIPDRVKGPSPDAARISRQEPLDALQHLPRGPIGEGHQHQPCRRHASFEQPCDAVGERPGLADPRAGDDQQRPSPGQYDLPLLLVENRRVIDPRGFDRSGGYSVRSTHRWTRASPSPSGA